MKKTIEETTRLLMQGTLTKDEADKILLDLHNVSNRRELLLAYSEFCYKEEWSMVDDQIIPTIDEFLSQ